MPTVKTAVIRDGVGDYRRGDIVQGAALDAFLSRAPNMESYHIVQLPVDGEPTNNDATGDVAGLKE